jgi:hypothetical protein
VLSCAAGVVGARGQLCVWGGECRPGRTKLSTPKHAGSRLTAPPRWPHYCSVRRLQQVGKHSLCPTESSEQKERAFWHATTRALSVTKARSPIRALEHWTSPHGIVKRDPFACHSGKSGCYRDSGRSRSVFDAQPVEDGRNVPLNCASTYD